MLSLAFGISFLSCNCWKTPDSFWKLGIRDIERRISLLDASTPRALKKSCSGSLLRWKSYREPDDGLHEPLLAVGNGDDQRVIDFVRPPICSPCHMVGWEGCAHLPASPDQRVQRHSAVCVPSLAFQTASARAQHRREPAGLSSAWRWAEPHVPVWGVCSWPCLKYNPPCLSWETREELVVVELPIVWASLPVVKLLIEIFEGS